MPTLAAELAHVDQVDLVRAHVLGTEIFGRAAEVARVGADLLEVRKLRVLGEIANAHVFEHPLAKRRHGCAPQGGWMRTCCKQQWHHSAKKSVGSSQASRTPGPSR